MENLSSNDPNCVDNLVIFTDLKMSFNTFSNRYLPKLKKEYISITEAQPLDVSGPQMRVTGGSVVGGRGSQEVISRIISALIPHHLLHVVVVDVLLLLLLLHSTSPLRSGSERFPGD